MSRFIPLELLAERRCKSCNKILINKEHRSVFYWSKRHFCNRKCERKFSLKRHQTKCLICKKLFVKSRPNGWYLYKGQVKTCSKKCAHKLCSKNQTKNPIRYWLGKRGQESPHWKGGVTLWLAEVRNLDKYKKWRLSVVKRDSFKCKECKFKGGWNKKLKKRIIINVDHITPFSFIIKKYNVQTIEEALKCKELWDINNGQ